MYELVVVVDGTPLDVLHLGGRKKMDEKVSLGLVQWTVLMVVHELKWIGSGHSTVICEDYAALMK